jgi:hypothetical protein
MYERSPVAVDGSKAVREATAKARPVLIFKGQSEAS